jgi:protein-tyrosine phosphatase
LIRVLFVCLGNICRSPIAEATFNELVQRENLDKLIECDSAGTAAYHIGSLPDKRIRKVAQDNGLILTHKARQLAYDDFLEFDYIMAMDQSNFEHIRKVSLLPHDRESLRASVLLYRSFDPEKGNSLDVPDPYYEDFAAFQNVYEIVRRSGSAFLDFLIAKYNLKAPGN